MASKARTAFGESEKDIKELYGYEAGMSQEERPPLDAYKPGDPEDFIK